MSHPQYTKRDLDQAIDLAIEETLRAVTTKIRTLAPSVSHRDPFPWRTGRDEALGAAIKIGPGAIKAEVHRRLAG